MAERRQQAIRNLDKGSFQGETGREDIHFMKQGIYEAANNAKLLSIIALDQDLETYELQRALPRAIPDVPGAAAPAAVTKAYDIADKLYIAEDTALRTLKQKVVEACDSMAKKVIEEPIHGTIRRTTTQILTLLTAEYSRMTHKEVMALKKKWESKRWDSATDVPTFTVTYRAEIAFLNMQVPGLVTDPEQVINYQEAFAHVPALQQLADARFYQTYPLQEHQTMENVTAIYREVYRTQYQQITATQYHQANEVKVDHREVSGTMANARDTTKGAPFTAKQMEAITAAIAAAMGTAKPTATGGQQETKRPKEPRPPRATQPLLQEETLLASGMCHRHAWYDKKHRWEHCFTNPDRVQSKA